MSTFIKSVAVLFALMLGSLSLSSLSVAATTGPDQLIKETSEKVLHALEQNKVIFKKHPEKMFELVNEIILPHLDFRAMSKLALGKNWRKVNKDQQERFVAAFKTMLIRTYSKSLTEYAGEEIKFLPYRPPAEGKRTVKVKTLIQQGTGPEIPINYSLRVKNDVWKVYDIKIDGISLVTNYRNTFASDINRVGIEGLIKKLQSKNRPTAQQSKA
ncbi:Phospholipid ABC transporter shuttle protein MlaC [hydrothermal vent metagenome]|uniref:Phospholipid ABC transporter shuttle protein MlaC n=1 Tax=hydrothermal vent metagenome TaxID=652676 RepID=A0A3B0XCA6_9ZZZZ